MNFSKIHNCIGARQKAWNYAPNKKMLMYKKLLFWDFVRHEPSVTKSPHRWEPNARDGHTIGPSLRMVQVRQNLKKKKTFGVGSQQSPFSISSSFILFLVFLPFFLKNKKFNQISAGRTKQVLPHSTYEGPPGWPEPCLFAPGSHEAGRW